MYYEGPMSLFCFFVLSKVLSLYQGYREAGRRKWDSWKEKGRQDEWGGRGSKSKRARVRLEVVRREKNTKLPQMYSRGNLQVDRSQGVCAGGGRSLLLFKNKTKNEDNNYIILTIKNTIHR